VNHKVFTFLTLGIVCPRKNQVWAVQLFTQFAGKRKDVKLLVVGVRHTRQYEIEYLEQVKKAIGKDDRIELHDVTSDVDQYYRAADCLLFTSVNEVTPMVISEAMSWGIPVLSTNIAGIPEMLTDGEEGFLFAPFDDIAALECMRIITEDPLLRENMGRRAIERFSARFDLDIMVEKYRQLLLAVAPPVILVDMDGVLVDWDSGFLTAWKGRSEVDRTKSYYMEHCVPPDFKRTAELLTHSEGFFESLPPMAGGIQAVKEIEQEGFRVLICTSPILTSQYCAQEKLNWIRQHMGEIWLEKVVLCADKASIRGDLLIDDKPLDYLTPCGRHTCATWKV
jgi:5'(3')-deoxyribonucleotidase